MKKYLSTLICSVLLCNSMVCEVSVAADMETQIKECTDFIAVSELLSDEEFLLSAGLEEYCTLLTQAFSETERQTIAMDVYEKVKKGTALTEAFKTALVGVVVPDSTRGKIVAFESFEYELGAESITGKTVNNNIWSRTAVNDANTTTHCVSNKKSLVGTSSYKVTGTNTSCITTLTTEPQAAVATVYVYDSFLENSLSNITFEVVGFPEMTPTYIGPGFDNSRKHNSRWMSNRVAAYDTSGNPIDRRKGWNKLAIVASPDGGRIIINGRIVESGTSLEGLTKMSNFAMTQRSGWGIGGGVGFVENPTYTDALTIIRYNPPQLSNISIVQNSKTAEFKIDIDYNDSSMQDPIYSVKWYAENELVATTDTLTYTPSAKDMGKGFMAVVTAENIYGLKANELRATITESKVGNTPSDKPIIFYKSFDTNSINISIVKNNNVSGDFDEYMALVAQYSADKRLKKVYVRNWGELETPVTLKIDNPETEESGVIKCMIWREMQPLTMAETFR